MIISLGPVILNMYFKKSSILIYIDWTRFFKIILKENIEMIGSARRVLHISYCLKYKYLEKLSLPICTAPCTALHCLGTFVLELHEWTPGAYGQGFQLMKRMNSGSDQQFFIKILSIDSLKCPDVPFWITTKYPQMKYSTFWTNFLLNMNGSVRQPYHQ